ncbi:MAG TPA: hypothetical protein VN728_11470 [Stellaceae bacterium]|nr:hypothetical protein [Stellaceae bacterium]
MGLSPSTAVRAQILLTADLRHDLFKVEYLLTTLSAAPAETSEHTYHLTWLRNRQRYLNMVLARRRALQQQKVVDLAAWRRATLPKESLDDVA